MVQQTKLYKTKLPIKRLGDFLHLENGRAYSQHELLDAGTPVLRIQNLNGGDRWYYSDLKLPPQKYCHKGDLLFAWSGSFGPYIWEGSESIFHYHIWKVIPLKEEADKLFAYYLLMWLTEEIKLAAHGVTMVHMTKEGMENWQIPLPSLDEQKRIATVLGEADHARRMRHFTQSISDMFLQQIFVEMFGNPVTNPMGWPWVQVDDLKANTKYSCVGGPFGSNLTTEDYVPVPGVPVIRGTNINSTSFQDSNFVYVSLQKAKSLVQNMAYPGDLVFTQRGTLGQIGYIPPNARFDRYVVSQSQMKLTPNLEKCDPLYIYQYFLTDYAQQRMQSSALVTGVPHTNLAILKEFPVMLPPLELQKKFSSVVIDYNRTQHQQQESARQAEHLFQTLLHRAFRGEL